MRITSFPEFVRLRSPLRPYQVRVLAGLDGAIDDDSLHVVAAPGSGKTVLGLEALCRVGKPALILSPTLAIRNQWVDRFCSLFLPPEEPRPDWISVDARRPSFLTVLTYQALHCACTGERDALDEEEIEEEASAEVQPEVSGERVDVISLLKEMQVGVIVVDEAHHLRSSWWKTLSSVREGLGQPKVIALTATPPYDVSPFEWERYKALCGPVDAEIAVPELVADGTLCPHQDYIYFNEPTDMERAVVEEYEQGVKAFCGDILADSGFLNILLSHPWISDPDGHVEEILSSPAYFSGMLIFIKAASGNLPKCLPRVLGVTAEEVPPLSSRWLETLLTGCLYADRRSYASCESEVAALEDRLRRIGAVEQRQVKLGSTDRIRKLLTSSINKMESILEIVRLESGSLGPDLRMVILTDYIRRAALPSSRDDIRPVTQIGVAPIFEKIRRDLPPGVRLGVLSGSLVIVPASARLQVESVCRDMDIPISDVSFSPLPHDEAYCSLTLCGANRERVVRLMTRVFSLGEINVLVGTKSLLGEGWDAPCINALVLASFVGSYMLSNQMRGRAIRSQNGNPDKTADIWHLACVQSTEEGVAGGDYETLRRRFQAFLGPSINSRTIESGIDRMGIGEPPVDSRRIREINDVMCARAVDRSALRRVWAEALEAGGLSARIVEKIRTPGIRLPRRFVFQNTLAALVRTGVGYGLYLFSELWQERFDVGDTDVLLRYLVFTLGVSTAATLPWLLKAAWLFVRHGSVESSMKQVSLALLEALSFAGAIKTPVQRIGVHVESDKDGCVVCSLENVTSRESSVFLDAVEELVGAVDNPRYLLVRPSVWLGIGRVDYHVVPTLLGVRKEYAERFAAAWKSRVGGVRLVYTRTPDGRRVLLRARGSSMAAGFVEKSARKSVWE